MSASDRLSGGALYQIAWELSEGEASPDDARRLLREFVDCIDANEHVPERLLQHFRDAFRAYLDGQKSIEAALGLHRSRAGHPGADEKRSILIAAAFLRHRLRGSSWIAAQKKVSYKSHASKTKVEEDWRHNKEMALSILRVERILAGAPWTDNELRRLRKLFKKEGWFPPERFSKFYPEN